ncbi:MAG: hypothetical protein GXP08_03755 [Gammaproteobacteria bacterium]|nr:hypothetical protein [Gammaproteobacteria bacterium]
MPYGRINTGRDLVKRAQGCQVVLKCRSKHVIIPTQTIGELTLPKIVVRFRSFRAGTNYVDALEVAKIVF